DTPSEPEQSDEERAKHVWAEPVEPVPSSRRKWLIVGGVLLVLIAAGVAFLVHANTKVAPVKESAAPSGKVVAAKKAQTAATKTSFTPKILANGDTQIGKTTWQKTPTKLDVNNYLLTKYETAETSGAYQIGKLDDGSMLVGVEIGGDGGGLIGAVTKV